MSLARFWGEQGRRKEAREILASVYGRFTEGFDTADLKEAAALLAVARWTKYSALARTESRGIHRRTDHPHALEHWCRRPLTGGLSTVWVRPQACEPAVPEPQPCGATVPAPQVESVGELERPDLASA